MSAFPHVLRRLAAVALACGLFAAGLVAAERIPPPPTRFVTDETRTLSRAAIERLNARLEQYERESSNQILVALFARMETDSSVEDYTVRVAESWRVGQKGRNNGAVLFVFKQDRQIYIQVGYGLEPTLTDAVCHQIIETILKPRFRTGDFDGGVNAAVDAMLAATRGEFKGTGRTHAKGYQPNTARGGLIFAVSIIGVPLLMFLMIRQAMRGPVVLGSPMRRRRNTWWDDNGTGGTWGGWSSGGGGDWSSGGGGGGGFSGGGGSFGGGGAGGKW